MKERKVLHGGGVSKPHTALDYASCYIRFSTPPLVLYFPYSTCNGALTSTSSTSNLECIWQPDHLLPIRGSGDDHHQTNNIIQDTKHRPNSD